MIVLDATVVVKLITSEPGARLAASRIVNESEFVTPAWVRLEVASALAKKVRRGAMSFADAKLAINAVEPLLSETVDPLNPLTTRWRSRAVLNTRFTTAYTPRRPFETSASC